MKMEGRELTAEDVFKFPKSLMLHQCQKSLWVDKKINTSKGVWTFVSDRFDRATPCSSVEVLCAGLVLWPALGSGEAPGWWWWPGWLCCSLDWAAGPWTEPSPSGPPAPWWSLCRPPLWWSSLPGWSLTGETAPVVCGKDNKRYRKWDWENERDRQERESKRESDGRGGRG